MSSSRRGRKRRMDRAYYQLIEDAIEIVRLSTAIAKNADYRDEIKRATDSIIVDACREHQRVIRILNDAIRRQETACNL